MSNISRKLLSDALFAKVMKTITEFPNILASDVAMKLREPVPLVCGCIGYLLQTEKIYVSGEVRGLKTYFPIYSIGASGEFTPSPERKRIKELRFKSRPLDIAKQDWMSTLGGTNSHTSTQTARPPAIPASTPLDIAKQDWMSVLGETNGHTSSSPARPPVRKNASKKRRALSDSALCSAPSHQQNSAWQIGGRPNLVD